MKSTTISKADLARLLDVKHQRVSQWIQNGLPVLSGGKLDRAEALRWIAGNCSSGWRVRDGKADISDRARALLDAGRQKARTVPKVERSSDSTRGVLDTILARRGELASLLLKLGVKSNVAIVAALELFPSVVIEFAGAYADVAYDFVSEDIPRCDIAAVLEKLGMTPLDDAGEAAVNEIVDAFYDHFNLEASAK